MKRPPELHLLHLLLALLAVNGLAGGAMLFIAPDGSLLQMDPSWIVGTPFGDYRLPGLLLFLCNGLLPAAALWGSAFRPALPAVQRRTLHAAMHWGWSLTIISGLTTILWIAIQQLLTRYFVLQPVIALLAALILILALSPRVMQWHRVPPV